MADWSKIKNAIAGIRNKLDDLESLIPEGQEVQLADQASTPPLYGRSANEGLHSLTSWPRFKYLSEQCKYLEENLDKAINATRDNVPNRAQGFRLLDANTDGRLAADQMAGGSGERRLEAALFEGWGFFRAPRDTKIISLWRSVAGKQIPLFDARQRDGWGHIDLLAVGHDYHPVIVELKMDTNRECPLRPLLEALSYAIALERVWVQFVEEYSELFEGTKNEEIAQPWVTKKIVIMAPNGYWNHWREPYRNIEGWARFRSLVAALLKRNFDISFWRCPNLEDDGQLVGEWEPARGPWSHTPPVAQTL